MKVKLYNPNYEDFQTQIGICYLFLYGIPFQKPNSKKPSINKEILNPIQVLPKSTSKDSEGKSSLDKDESHIQKILKERLSGVGLNQNNSNVKNMFKDRSSTKDEKLLLFFFFKIFFFLYF